MFQWIKNMFTVEPTITIPGEINMTATIVPTSEGKFALTTRSGLTVGTYSRKRDAVRGATRRGYTVKA